MNKQTNKQTKNCKEDKQSQRVLACHLYLNNGFFCCKDNGCTTACLNAARQQTQFNIRNIRKLGMLLVVWVTKMLNLSKSKFPAKIATNTNN